MVDSAIAALFGALIGAAASVGAMWIQQRYQTKRDLLKVAVDLARDDWKFRADIIGKHGGTIIPIATFVYYHARVLDDLANGTFSADTVRSLTDEQERLIAAYNETNEEIRRKLQS